MFLLQQSINDVAVSRIRISWNPRHKHCHYNYYQHIFRTFSITDTAKMKCSILFSAAILFGASSAAVMVFDKRSTCQVGDVGPLNAGDAACSASVSNP